MRETFHLVPAEVWAAADPAAAYSATSLDGEGFAHCTDGLAALGATFDHHYATDPRSFMALAVDLDALEVPWRYDVPDSPYPHIYGPIPRTAIVSVASVERRSDGGFAGLTPA